METAFENTSEIRKKHKEYIITVLKSFSNESPEKTKSLYNKINSQNFTKSLLKTKVLRSEFSKILKLKNIRMIQSNSVISTEEIFSLVVIKTFIESFLVCLYDFNAYKSKLSFFNTLFLRQYADIYSDYIFLSKTKAIIYKEMVQNIKSKSMCDKLSSVINTGMAILSISSLLKFEASEENKQKVQKSALKIFQNTAEFVGVDKLKYFPRYQEMKEFFENLTSLDLEIHSVHGILVLYAQLLCVFKNLLLFESYPVDVLKKVVDL
jgi:hypothetical protein